MFGFDENEKPASKCYADYGALPSFVDAKAPPTKKKPFSTVRSHSFNHTAELVLPKEMWATISSKIEDTTPELRASKLIMSLSDLLEDKFFNTCIRSGNVLMISKGRMGLDNTYTLCDGVLRLLLDKESYERAGLLGAPSGTIGSKRKKARWMVEINLRLPSMRHGKKGFDKIVWAFKNVLSQPLDWLFCDLDPTKPSTDLIAAHHPINKVYKPEVFHTQPVQVPMLHPPNNHNKDAATEFDEYVADVYEWLNMVSLPSPRINVADGIDPYLSRYEIPNTNQSAPQVLVRLRWRGLLPASWIMDLWLNTLRLTRSLATEAWFALSVDSYSAGYPNGTNCFTILRLPPSISLGIDSHPKAGETEFHAGLGSTQDAFVLWELNGN